MITRKTLFVITSILIIGLGYGQAQSGFIAGQDTSRRVITTAVPFLTISPDARSGALGDAGAALSADANAMHWNVAKLAFIQQDIDVSLSYTPWLGKLINDMSITYLSGAFKLSDVEGLGVSIRYFDLGSIQETFGDGTEGNLFNPREFAIDAGYSRLLSDRLSLGVALRFIHSNLTGNFTSQTIEARPASSVGVDIGVYYEKPLLVGGKDAEFALSALISNIGPKLTYTNEDNRDFIPTNLRIGGRYDMELDPYNSFTFLLDFNKLMAPTPPIYELDENGRIQTDPNTGEAIIASGQDPNRPLLSGVFGSFGDAPDGFSEELQEVMISTGVEYWYNDLFAARVGYFHENTNKGNRKFFTAGLGFRYQVFGIDFAYLIPTQQEHPLAETLRFTLRFNFENQDKGGDNSDS